MIIAQRGARVKCRPLDELLRAMKINAANGRKYRLTLTMY
jgi:hypothetical protein